MTESVTYASGPDLSRHFAKPEPPSNLSLPTAFDDSCKKCDVAMEPMEAPCLTRHRPFRTFQCPACKVRLFLIETATTPLFLWSYAIPSGSAMQFSTFIDQKIEEREEKRKTRVLREQAALEAAV